MHIGYRFSLLLNVLLAVAVVVAVTRRPSESRPAPAMATSKQAAAAETAKSAQPRMPSAEGESAGPALRRQLVDELRAKGVPENVLARFVYADIEESWAPRYEACHGDQDKLPLVQ